MVDSPDLLPPPDPRGGGVSSIPDADKRNHRCLPALEALPRSCTGLSPSDQCIPGWGHKMEERFYSPGPSAATPSINQNLSSSQASIVDLWRSSWVQGSSWIEATVPPPSLASPMCSYTSSSPRQPLTCTSKPLARRFQFSCLFLSPALLFAGLTHLYASWNSAQIFCLPS